MAALSQHSLPFSSSTPSTPTANRPSQLPSSLSSVGVSTRFDNPASTSRLRSGSTSNTSVSHHQRTGSNISSTSRPHPSVHISHEPTSPTRRSFISPSSPNPTSLTHAGGILPSASFFRPSRPNQPSLSYPHSRPSSAGSSHPGSPTHDTQIFSLQQFHPLSNEVMYESDDGMSARRLANAPAGERTSHASTTLTLEDPAHQLPVKNAKFSREPLLPIGASGMSHKTSSNSLQSRPSQTTRGASEKTLSPTHGSSPGGRVRDSLGKFGISLESVRRSLSGGGLPSPDVRVMEEPKPFDDYMEHRYKSVHSPSLHLRQPTSPHSFNPYPPDINPPLSATPRLDEKTKRATRNYELLPSRNRFFCEGMFLTGGDSPWAFIGSLVLVFGIAGTWFGTTCVWWWHNESPAVAAIGAYMTLLTITLMLSTVRILFRGPTHAISSLMYDLA